MIVQVGYQFVMRWVNNHIYYLKAKSPLALRILNTVYALPYEDSKAWRRRVMTDVCGPKGYQPVTDHKKFRDIYNICVLKSVMAANENYGDDGDNVLLDHPLVRNSSFWRPIFRHGPSCFQYKRLCHTQEKACWLLAGLVGSALAAYPCKGKKHQAPQALCQS